MRLCLLFRSKIFKSCLHLGLLYFPGCVLLLIGFLLQSVCSQSLKAVTEERSFLTLLCQNYGSIFYYSSKKILIVHSGNIPICSYSLCRLRIRSGFFFTHLAVSTHIRNNTLRVYPNLKVPHNGSTLAKNANHCCRPPVETA